MVDIFSKDQISCADELYNKWLKEYRKKHIIQAADFWNTFPEYKYRDRFTHMIHSYPAKLLASIPAFFITVFCEKRSKVLDPFCGSGTVMLEAVLHGQECYGVEVNPVARLISQTKITPIEPAFLQQRLAQITRVVHRMKFTTAAVPELLNFWFTPQVRKQLLILRETLKTCEYSAASNEIAIRNFFWMCFSSLIRSKSLADPCVAPPVKLRPEKFIKNPARHQAVTKLIKQKKATDTFDVFEDLCIENIERMKELYDYFKEKHLNFSGRVIWDDARTIKKSNLGERGILDCTVARSFSSGSIDLIVTSPPYINAQKYTRSLSLEMYWLEHWHNPEDRAAYDQRVLGNERVSTNGEFFIGCNVPLLKKELLRIASIDRKRAAIVNAFFDGLQEALKECYRVLKKGGHLVLVTGNNKIFGKEIPTHQIFMSLAAQIGFVLELVLYDDIKSWGLMTKRNYTADIITREWILVFRRES